MMSTTGSMIEEAEAEQLSRKLCQLGDQWEDICAELDHSGYGLPAAVVREAQESLAVTEERRMQLREYWREYAKERLAGLVGPMNVLAGKLPKTTAYRSNLLARLRTDVAAGKLRSEGAIVSPQIEPTVKRYVEMMPDDPQVIQINDRVKQARKQATAKLLLTENPEFSRLSAKARYNLLIERYSAGLLPAGFNLDSHRKTGLVFRKLTSDLQWAFLFVDESQEGVDSGMLFSRFAITLPKKAVLPRALSLSAVATFSPDDVVPGFGDVRGFARDSYAQFCLAADANAFLARLLYERIDALLVGG